MSFGICNLSIVPLRLEPSDASEMVNQLVFGEHFEVLEKTKKWSKIRLSFDNYEGYIDNKQYEEISTEKHQSLSNEKAIYAGELIDFITDNNHNLTTIPLGARLPFFNDNKLHINDTSFIYEGKTNHEKLPKSALIDCAFLFINVPYLWGGKSPFGIDCSGLTQLCYRMGGISIYRDASQQARQGELLSFPEEAKTGDLAFFDNEEGNITHAGIILDHQQIIHASGEVRIDMLDNQGIFNRETGKHSHQLRLIRSFM